MKELENMFQLQKRGSKVLSLSWWGVGRRGGGVQGWGGMGWKELTQH